MALVKHHLNFLLINYLIRTLAFGFKICGNKFLCFTALLPLPPQAASENTINNVSANVMIFFILNFLSVVSVFISYMPYKRISALGITFKLSVSRRRR